MVYQNKKKLAIKNIKPDIRYLTDIKAVVFDKKWLKNANEAELYYMYRGLKKKNGLRYDITIIPAKMLGREFVKTKGHEHLGKRGEVYLVLKGEAIYLMQKRIQGRKTMVKDVYAVRAKKGDVIAIPPHYGHVTINPTNRELKMANWVSEKCCSDYQLYEKMGGACYFYTKNGWQKNPRYKKVPKLKIKKPLKKIPEDLSFL